MHNYCGPINSNIYYGLKVTGELKQICVERERGVFGYCSQRQFMDLAVSTWNSGCLNEVYINCAFRDCAQACRIACNEFVPILECKN